MRARVLALAIGVLCVDMLAAQTAPPRDATPSRPATGTGRISGRVFAAETGTPLPKAHVRLNAAQLMLGALTDVEGRYQFTDLPAGAHSISVSKPGYVTLQHGQRRSFESGRPLNLKEGQHADRIDFALPRGSVITGRITDEFGLPVTGARVQAMRYQYSPDGERQLVSGNTGMFFNHMTDDLGHFRVFGLAPGTYVVAASAPLTQQPSVARTVSGSTVSVTTSSVANNGINEGYATTYFPGVATSTAASEISVGLGQELTASFSLIPARLSRISGVVLTSEGQPARDISVFLRQVQGQGFSNFGMGSDGTGNFSASNVIAGEYFIDVRPAMRGGPNMPPAPTSSAEFASVPITVTGEDISGLVVVTSRGATIVGRAMFEGTKPRPPGASPFRVAVMPVGPGPGMPMNSRDSGLVDESGNFRLDGVAGRVMFRGGGPGWTIKTVRLNGVEITDVPYDVKPGANIAGIEVVFTDRQQAVAGTATDPSGVPLKEYLAVFVPQKLPEGAVPTRWLRIGASREDGGYEVRGLPAGSYAAAAVSSLEQGGLYDPAFQDQVKQRGTAIDINEGDTLKLDLRLLQ